MNVSVRFAHRMRERGDDTALIGREDRVESYRDIAEQTRQVAAYLDERDIGAGDRVAVYMPDTPSYIPAVLGIWHVGAIASPVNTRFGFEELEYTLSDLEPSALIGSDAFENNVADLRGHIDGLTDETTVLLDQEGSFATAALPSAEQAPEITRRMDDDTAVIMYTSGTTGRPKGVIQTHRNVDAQLDVNVTHFDITADDVTVSAVPLFHVGGLYGGALPAMLEGATLVIPGIWDAELWARLVEEHEGTFSGLIPTMMLDALNTDGAVERDTSSLQQVVYGGSPATEETLSAFQSTFEVDALRNYYGQTENTGLSVTYDVDTERRPGLSGRPVHAVDYRIVEPTAERLVDVETGEPGELLLRGDIISPGYWDESLNDEYFTEGWLHTDDIFQQDENGLLYYVDRVDDMIISGGENVAPSEVENALQRHPDIEAVAVFGTDHERLGETVTAAVLAPDARVDGAEIEDWWNESVDLAGYKRPRRVESVEAFPRTASQKVDKVSLKEQLTADE